MCNLLCGVRSELTVSQAHVLSVTHTHAQLRDNNGVHLLFALLRILMPLVDSLTRRPAIQQTFRINELFGQAGERTIASETKTEDGAKVRHGTSRFYAGRGKIKEPG